MGPWATPFHCAPTPALQAFLERETALKVSIRFWIHVACFLHVTFTCGRGARVLLRKEFHFSRIRHLESVSSVCWAQLPSRNWDKRGSRRESQRMFAAPHAALTGKRPASLDSTGHFDVHTYVLTSTFTNTRRGKPSRHMEIFKVQDFYRCRKS